LLHFFSSKITRPAVAAKALGGPDSLTGHARQVTLQAGGAWDVTHFLDGR